jgi:hypothetical protein
MSLSTVVAKINALEKFISDLVTSYNTIAHTHADDVSFYSLYNGSGYSSIDFTSNAGDPAHGHKIHCKSRTVAAPPKALETQLEFTPGGTAAEGEIES